MIIKNYKRLLQRILRKAERDHYEAKFLEYANNIKRSWDLIKEVINKKKAKRISDTFIIDNKEVNDPKIISNNFNNYFLNVGLELSRSVPNSNISFQSYLPDAIPDSFFIAPTSCEEVSKIIMSFKNKSAGWDNVCAKVVKETYPLIIQPLTYIINLSLSQGIVPNEMKRLKSSPYIKEEIARA